MVMKKFLNDPNDLTAELLEGYTKAYEGQVKLVSDKIVVRAQPKDQSQVAVVTLGGAGHEPALSGYVGQGLLDASVVGDVFAAPGAPKVLEALRMFKRDAGILLVVLNHAGDVLSGNMAAQMAEKEGIKVQTILTHEDIAPGIDTPIEDRRGLGGCIPLIKITGAAAEAGKSLEEVYEIAERFGNQMATLSVTMKTATHPQTGEYIAELADDELEIGMGQHGEGGGGRFKVLSADETAENMVTKLAAAVSATSGDRVQLIVNGSGATTYMEMFVVYRKARAVLDAMGVEVITSRVEEMLTVQESGGFQMFLAKLDDELAELMTASSNAPYWVTR
jgi:phosphoenolpyruvate---glycerone phosphotransferase subunit DhaK